MSKLVYMGSGAIDPIAQSKRVFWRPATPGTALRVGDPVCYKLDAVDHKERTVDPVHLGLTRDTYQEGEQEMTGRLFSVEEPLVDNIGAFAGIVKAIGSLAGADGDMIEIWTANSGAVVPANVVLTTTTAGRTLLAVMVGTRTLGSPTTDTADFETDSDTDTDGSLDSKVVGIAMESLTAAGLCWIKLDENAFVHQGGQIGQDFLVTSVADDVTVNKMFLNIAVTAGHCQALHYRTVMTGTGGDANRGVYRFDTIFRGVPADNKHIFGVNCHMEIGAGWGASGGHCSPLKITVRTQNADPDLSGLGVLSAIHIDWILRKTTTTALTNPPRISCLIYVNEDGAGSIVDFFMVGERYGSLGIGTDALGGSAHAAARTLKIKASSIALFIPCYTAAELAS